MNLLGDVALVPKPPVEEKPLVTATRCAALLADILKWKLQIPEHQPSIRSVPTDGDSHRGSGEPGLPFGLSAIIDTTATEGAAGVTTETGADTWLEMWAAWLAWILDQSYNPTKTSHGAWLLKQLQENQELIFIEEWDDWAKAEWKQFSSELSRLWWRTGRLTGNAPQNRTVCPRCKQGVIRQAWTDHGISETGKCSNRECDVIIDYSVQYAEPLPDDATLAQQEAAIKARELLQEINHQSYRAALRDETLTNTWVTFSEVKAIWPRLNPSTLRTWVERGHVTKRDGYYNLGEINYRKWNPQ